MSSGTAIVKQVISGDTVVLVGVPKGGPPPEKQICLISLVAPRVAMKSLTKELQDEPYGWAAREFLRKLIIGKEVEFKVEYSQNGKEYGWIKFNAESVSYELLKKGLVRLKSNRNPPCASDYDELEKCEEIAKEAKLGLWDDEAGSGQSTVRNITWALNDVTLLKNFVEKNKSNRLKGIVEYVRDGGCMRVLFTDDMIYCSVLISGIQCDGFKREMDENGQEKFVAEPFAAEAKFFVEYRLLNRDVEVRVEASDDYGNMYGSIYHPNGNIAVLLLANGFAKIQDWSANLTESTAALRGALQSAQAKKLRKWKNWQDTTVPVDEADTKYQAKVREVPSGDSIIVEMLDGSERRLYLASIRCPKLGGRNREEELWAFEAKELVRKSLIGKKVKVELEYVRELTANNSGIPLPPASDSQGRMHCVSVYFDNKNIQEILISEGFARITPHRLEDKRAQNYDVLVDLEKQAMEKKVGVHSLETPQRRHRINDLTGQENIQRAKSFVKQLSQQRKLTGVVDHIFQCGKYKIRIPSENIYIAFILGMIKFPQVARFGSGGKGNDPFAEEGLAYARNHLLQREVSIKIESGDLRGNFFGFLWYNKRNFAVDLLEQGFASIWNIGEAPSSLKDQFISAEQKGKAAKLRIWNLPGALENGVQEPSEKEVDELYPAVCVTFINSILDFYIQEVPSPTLSNIMKHLSNYQEGSSEEFTERTPPRKGELIIGKFSVDDQWYRARVESYDPITREASLLYIDFGNFECLPFTKMRRCPKEISSLKEFPPQAKLCALAGLLQPIDFEDEAGQHFHELAENKILQCRIEKYDKTHKRYVILTEQEAAASSHAGNSINEIIMRQGFARLDKRSNTKIFSRLQKEEETARKSHINVWRYGDVGDDEDTIEDFPSLSNKRTPGKQ